MKVAVESIFVGLGKMMGLFVNIVEIQSITGCKINGSGNVHHAGSEPH
jgi:hypothetical protein